MHGINTAGAQTAAAQALLKTEHAVALALSGTLQIYNGRSADASETHFTSTDADAPPNGLAKTD